MAGNASRKSAKIAKKAGAKAARSRRAGVARSSAGKPTKKTTVPRSAGSEAPNSASQVIDPRTGQRGKSKTDSTIRFSATLHRPAATDKTRTAVSWTFLKLPDGASRKLPSRGQTTVEGTLNGHPFQATLEPDGRGAHWLKVDRTLREAAGVAVRDVVELEISPVSEEPEPKVPADLQRALAGADVKARAAWTDITPAARRDFIHWITSGKRAETRGKRIATACDMLAKGKRRPCCFDRSGMYDKSLSCPVADDD